MRISAKSRSFKDILDALFGVSSEAIAGKGEDSFCCSYSDTSALIGVFDGCGGLGARQYEKYEDHTGAYMASRLASGAVYNWFQTKKRTGHSSDPASEMKEAITSALSTGKRKGGSTLVLRVTMVRDFPSTAAIALAEYSKGRISLNLIWAGDSRLFFLGSSGLSALSEDDTDSSDAFEDLRNDPVQTNVLSSDGNYILHSRTMSVSGPMILLSCTDGYFGYWNTPMQFEYFLLDTLERASSFQEWKELLQQEILEVTGDDATLAGMLFQFGTFEEVKKYFRRRHNELYEQYIAPLDENYSEERAREYWQAYRGGYEQYLPRNRRDTT